MGRETPQRLRLPSLFGVVNIILGFFKAREQNELLLLKQ